MKLGRR